MQTPVLELREIILLEKHTAYLRIFFCLL